VKVGASFCTDLIIQNKAYKSPNVFKRSAPWPPKINMTKRPVSLRLGVHQSTTVSLLSDPEAHTSALIEQAKQARAQGIIGGADLRELLEWVDSAYSWAVEEQLTRELNQ
jgi:phosphatidylserine/phosphatidylglycerophosphate/cardiolipin synthase-like enzyme